jgi:integrase
MWTLEAGHLTVRSSRVQVGWSVVEGDPKSDAGGRHVGLDGGTVAVLAHHRALQLEQRAAWHDSGLVFVREDGPPLHPESVSDRFGALVEASRLPPIKLHGLQHGSASLMLAPGVPLKVVSETLGHSTLGLTADTYTSVFPECRSLRPSRSLALSRGLVLPVGITSASHDRGGIR